MTQKDDSILTVEQIRNMIIVVKIMIKDIETIKSYDKSRADNVVQIKKDYDYYIDLIKKLINISNDYDKLHRLEIEYPEECSDRNSHHGMEHFQLLEEIKKSSLIIKREYNDRHHKE